MIVHLTVTSTDGGPPAVTARGDDGLPVTCIAGSFSRGRRYEDGPDVTEVGVTLSIDVNMPDLAASVAREFNVTARRNGTTLL